MLRSVAVAGVLAAVLLGAAALNLTGSAAFAQEATPEAMVLAEGVSLEVVAAGAAAALPPTPAMWAI